MRKKEEKKTWLLRKETASGGSCNAQRTDHQSSTAKRMSNHKAPKTSVKADEKLLLANADSLCLRCVRKSSFSLTNFPFTRCELVWD